MYLATVRSRDARSTTVAVGDDRGWVILDDLADVHALLADADWRERAAHALTAERIAAEELDFLNPTPTPAKILCCGLNYRDHIVETGREIPAYPTLFAKFADTLTDPDATITVSGSGRVDWEAELAVVIGEPVAHADDAAAAAAILGYTVANDISMRDWQQRTLQWLQGKAFDRTTPIGPYIVTADVLDPRDGLRVECEVNGEIMQSGNTAELVFDAARLVSYISQFTRLNPGDVILTGTPGGVGMGMPEPRYLRNGDLLTTRIEGIGELRNTVMVTHQ